MIKMDKKALLRNLILIAAIYFLFAKPVLNFFRKKGDEKYNDESDNPLSPLLPNLWQKYFYIYPMPASGRRMITLANYTRLKDAAKSLYSSFGYLTDDETKFFASLNKCKTQAEVSLLAAILQETENVSLLSLMKYGKGALPNNGLSDKEMANAISFVKNLPIY